MRFALLGSGVLSSVLLVGVVGCTTDAPPSNPPPAQDPSKLKTQPPATPAAVKMEAKEMKQDGQQLKQQGDEPGGQRLIEEAKLREAGAGAAVPAKTVPDVAATTKPAQP